LLLRGKFQIFSLRGRIDQSIWVVFVLVCWQIPKSSLRDRQNTVNLRCLCCTLTNSKKFRCVAEQKAVSCFCVVLANSKNFQF
jgi:hypothetical protein